MDEYNSFLETSPLAARVKLEAAVILRRTALSSRDLVRARRIGELDLAKGDESRYELEVGGQTVAVGKLVNRFGKRYFKVTEVFK